MRFRKPSASPVKALPFEQCPAKTWMRSDGVVVAGRSVPNHCQIVGETARCLIQRFPEPLRQLLFPPGSELAAAAHDIGKVSPTFVAKILRACGVNYRAMPELSAINPDMESLWGGHAGVSQATAEELGLPRYIPEILGQHHGFSPRVSDKPGNAEVFGGDAWFAERQKLVDELRQCLQTDWPTFNTAAQARVVAGLTSVADWIGSGEFFENPQDDWHPNIQAALNNAGFITPELVVGLSFSDLFSRPDQPMQARPAQQLFMDQVAGPGVYILEAEMGMGKTEAALFAAYQMLVSRQATGIYFALPTQLTSNKIYERFNAFLNRIVAPRTPNRALLLHSGARLLEQEMGEEGRPGGAWFNQRKRGLLAPFAVGTIDQALMAVMNVKHGFVRAFGLAGKVVILDEVHSYDLYTGTLLNELVLFLRQIGCTVIILSATLSQQRRQLLLQQSIKSQDYPLVSAQLNSGSEVHEISVPVQDRSPVTLAFFQQDDAVIDEVLQCAAAGQQVLWIENTVVEAQQRYLDLASHAVAAGCDIGLLHSRFTPHDRACNEARWVKAFGRDGWTERHQKGRILIGTQVLEQSLDIDADALVTRFAPTDMLLQRIGRLWRHADTPRHPAAQKICWILAPQLDKALSNPRAAFGATALVYSPYVLCRSLQVWQALDKLALPSRIRPLIDQTYAEREEQDEWAGLLHELKQGNRWRTGEEALQALAKLTLAKDGKTLPEHQAETRYNDQDTHEVLLVRSIRTTSETGMTCVRLLDDTLVELPYKKHGLSRAAWRSLAIRLHQQIVRIKPADCPPALPRHELEKMGFQQVFYLGEPEWDEAILRVAIVSEGGEIQTLDRHPVREKGRLEYRNDLGYRVITSKE